MKIQNLLRVLRILSIIPLCFLSDLLEARDRTTRKRKQKQSLSQTMSASQETLKSIVIDYKDTPLASIVNEFAARKEINILLPSAGIKEKVTLRLDKKVSPDQAWSLLQTILEAADYVLVPKNNMLVVMKNSKTIPQEPLTIYLNIPYQELPNNDAPIRYIHYLTNIKVSTEPLDEVSGLLKALLPETGASFITDPVSNAIIIAARGSDIRGVMEIINRLDQPGFEEKMEIIPLQIADCEVIANLFNDNILKVPQQFQPYNVKQPQKSDTSYFERDTRIMAEKRTNSLIVVGRSQAVDRIKEFIFNHLDVATDTGKSVLHVYELQYLDAEKFADVLAQIVQQRPDTGTGQSRTGDPQGGTERFFEGVKIRADSRMTAKGGVGHTGSNKLIIAARKDDWKRIKKLIQELDTPQRQVFIEVLIADLTLDDQRLLGAMLRNPANIPLPGQIDFQSAQFSPGVLPNTFNSPTPPATVGFTHDINGNPIASDLLRLCLNGTTEQDGGTAAITSLMKPGSTVLAVNDNSGKTWGLLQMIQTLNVNKIISTPHVVAVHNQVVEFVSKSTRFLTGEASGNINPVVKNENVEAALELKLIPRISSGGVINIQVEIKIDEFLGVTTGSDGNARDTRILITNANVANTSILAIGGLSQKTEESSVSETPLLAKIPVIGNLFKSKARGSTHADLMVFIRPTIIEPRLRNGVDDFTRDYINLAKELSKDSDLFGDLRDPISRWYFNMGEGEQEALEAFYAESHLYDAIERKTTKITNVKEALIKPPLIKDLSVQNETQAPQAQVYAQNESAHHRAQDSASDAADSFRTMLADEENPFVTS
jgi:general secretion pathway protein D